jgi:hypothetical protein
MRVMALLLLSSLAIADCKVADVIPTLRPGAAWTITDNDTSTLVWQSTQTIPTALEVAVSVNDCKAKAASRFAAKAQARIDVKNTSLTQAQRLAALLILLDYDQ